MKVTPNELNGVIRILPRVLDLISSKSSFAKNVSGCWRYDVRLGDKSPTCSKYTKNRYSSINVRIGGLFNETFASSKASADDVWVTSNSIPVYAKFSDEIIPKFYDFLFQKLKKVKIMNIVTGPIFIPGMNEDESYNKRSKDIPSHFFYVLTSCKGLQTHLNSCNPEQLELSAFILPHIPKITHCQNIEEWVIRNSARVRDVELLTGIQFYTKFPADVRARLVVNTS
ncbi:Venom phosphodiesterase 2 [Nymphon striatum]|nr:Venom phosphodiesterase 2 [Nymphon striatum]